MPLSNSDSKNSDSNTRPTIRLGTRGSMLALWQSNWVKAQLESQGANVQLITIKTEGDTATGPLAQIGGQGLFTKRIQTALLQNEIDLAVHSLKDLPTQDIPGLKIAAIPDRENCLDALVSNQYSDLAKLPHRSKIGTGSVRRAAQLLHLRDDLRISDCRGNVDTRLKKLDDGEYDAIILACSGLIRLGLADRISYQFKPTEILPAVGQGALALETREDDVESYQIVVPLNHEESYFRAMAERVMLKTLFAGCLSPVGSFTSVVGERLTIEGVVLSRDGQERIHSSIEGEMDFANEMGVQLAEELISQGAGRLLKRDPE